MSMFFVSALLLARRCSRFGTTDALGNPRFGTTLDNTAALFETTYLRVIVRSWCYAAARAPSAC